jgi:hypothetical protein
MAIGTDIAPRQPGSRRNWDGLAAVIAAFVGLLALCVSGYTAYLQRQQVRAQVWPYLEPGISSSRRRVSLFNKGVGPALIRSVTISVDGKPQRNWKAVFAALGLDYDHHIPYSTINGVVVPANDHIDQLVFPTAEDFDRYARQIKRIDLSLCYCSSLDECWTYEDTAATLRGHAHQPVARCPVDEAAQFRDNESPEPALPYDSAEKSAKSNEEKQP